MPFPTPHESLMDAIARFEGGWQADANDSGNYVNCAEGRRLIGTHRGVTPATLARHLGVDKCSLTPERMRELVTPDVAARVGLTGFYDEPGFDDLEWSPLVAIAVDIGWGSGPIKGVRMLQQLIGATADGKIGPQTQKLYARFIHEHPSGEAVDALSKARRDFYIEISQPGDKDHRFQRGWLRRADYYTTKGNGIDGELWWPKWAGWTPSGASETGKPVALPERREPPSPPPPPDEDYWHGGPPGAGLLAIIARLVRALFGGSR